MLRRLVPALLLLMALGCGGGDSADPMPKLYPVRGTVRYDSKRLAGAEVRFQPERDDPNLTVRGTTDTQGRFELITLSIRGNAKQEGAPAGTYTVTVMPRMDQKQQGLPPTQAPQKYTVQAGDNDFTIHVARPKGK